MRVPVHAKTRPEAIARMRRALDEFIVGGIRTNIEFHKALLADHEVVSGTMTTRTVERIMARQTERHGPSTTPPPRSPTSGERCARPGGWS